MTIQPNQSSSNKIFYFPDFSASIPIVFSWLFILICQNSRHDVLNLFHHRSVSLRPSKLLWRKITVYFMHKEGCNRCQSSIRSQHHHRWYTHSCSYATTEFSSTSCCSHTTIKFSKSWKCWCLTNFVCKILEGYWLSRQNVLDILNYINYERLMVVC